MELTPTEAGKLVGRSKGAIIKAIHDGRMSAERQVNGAFTIQPVELFRVFKPVNGDVNGSEHLGDEVNTSEIVSLQVENRMLRERLVDKDEVIRSKDQVIEGKEAEITRLAAVVAQLSPPKAQRGWWARLLGGA